MKNDPLLKFKFLISGLVWSLSATAQFTAISLPTGVGDISELVVPHPDYIMLGVNYGSSPYYDSTAFYRSSDAGLSWHRFKVKSTLQASLISTGALSFKDTLTGYLGLGQNKECRTLHYTQDGGRTWTQKEEVGSAYRFQDVWIHPSGHLDIACGSRMAKATEQGTSWTTTFIPGTPSLYEDIEYVDDSTGYACGWYAGTIIKTTDQGHTWQQIQTPASNPVLYCLHFPTADTGYVAGNSVLYKTTDGGTSWNTYTLSFSANDIRCLTARHCLCAADQGVYETRDGGVHWVPIYTSPDKLFKVTQQQDYLYIGGENAVLLKTLISSLSYSQKQNTDLHLLKLFPNPTENLIYLTYPDRLLVYEISLIGETGTAWKVENPGKTVNSENLNPGVYIAHIITDQGEISQKVLIR